MKRAQTNYQIKCLVPDLPAPEELLPFLNQMHNSRWYSNFGELSNAFARSASELIEAASPNLNISACLTQSATQSLELALASLNIDHGKNVLVPSLTFPASATAIIKSGLIPLFSDVSPDCWQLTPEIAYDAAKYFDISAVMPVATFGAPVETSQWDKFHNDTGIPVVIDASGAFPFQKLGEDCLIVISFHATKALGIGEGGGIFTTNQLLSEKLNRASNFGFHNGVIESVGCNAKMSEYHAAVGLAQLKRWPDIQNKRIKICDWYQQLLFNKTGSLEKQPTTVDCVPSLKIVKLARSANSILEHMKRNQIECRRWYYPPLHHHPGLFTKGKLVPLSSQSIGGKYQQNANHLETTDQLANQLLGIPFHNFLSFEDVKRISNCLLNEIEPYGTNRELHGKS